LAGAKSKSRETRTIVVRDETYNRLEKLKVKLIAERGTSDVTFDDAINTLLNGVEG
jgi:predicted CopG family antitoxin